MLFLLLSVLLSFLLPSLPLPEFIKPLENLHLFPGGTVVKYPSANAGDTRDASSVPVPERCPRGGNGKPLQYSCLENSMDRGAWRGTVHGVAKSQTQLKQLGKPASNS